MRILLLNVHHPSIGSSIADHLPPLGLLSIGGPLIDDGHEVRLINGELGPMSEAEMADQAVACAPEVILFGHSGSTSAHAVIAALSRRLRDRLPQVTMIYGGVFPTYHWREILAEEPQIDLIVRGEGEETCRRVVACLAVGRSWDDVPGIAYRRRGQIHCASPAPLIRDLDSYRVAWELIEHRRYTYWGGKCAVVAQFSRGCPHHCTFCGQHGFWTRWRHRDPRRFAAELARLYREHGVRIVNLADENPSASRRAWETFLSALIAENVPLTLVGSTRADDIVRDADILHLYKKAGFERLLLGTEHTDEATLAKIAKGSSTATDREAVRLLRRHGILSLATFVVGLEEETDRDYWRALRQLLVLDADQISIVYATPHRWTPFYDQSTRRRVIQLDRRWWDYKHQVLATRLAAWRVLLWVKFIEAVVQLRPRALWRTLVHPQPRLRPAMRWYTALGWRVWPTEIWNFLFRENRVRNGPTLREFWGEPQCHEAKAMADGKAQVITLAPAQPACPPRGVCRQSGARYGRE
jgi:anaerobic magnesium-protoporphyrin IX monomethyl ester cyclase